MGFFIVASAAFLCTVPSSFIARWLMRRRGRELSVFDAPAELMKVGHPAEKIALITLNFAVLGAGIWLLAHA